MLMYVSPLSDFTIFVCIAVSVFFCIPPSPPHGPHLTNARKSGATTNGMCIFVFICFPIKWSRLP